MSAPFVEGFLWLILSRNGSKLSQGTLCKKHEFHLGPFFNLIIFRCSEAEAYCTDVYRIVAGVTISFSLLSAVFASTCLRWLDETPNFETGAK